jgi:hypothetical protein
MNIKELWVNLSKTGKVIESSTSHPVKPPRWGGVWVCYAPANSNLIEALAEIAELKAENDRMSGLLSNIAAEYCGLSKNNKYGEYFKGLIVLAFAETKDAPSPMEGK